MRYYCSVVHTTRRIVTVAQVNKIKQAPWIMSTSMTDDSTYMHRDCSLVHDDDDYMYHIRVPYDILTNTLSSLGPHEPYLRTGRIRAGRV